MGASLNFCGGPEKFIVEQINSNSGTLIYQSTAIYHSTGIKHVAVDQSNLYVDGEKSRAPIKVSVDR